LQLGKTRGMLGRKTVRDDEKGRGKTNTNGHDQKA
jgi:hypothetical protein